MAIKPSENYVSGYVDRYVNLLTSNSDFFITDSIGRNRFTTSLEISTFNHSNDIEVNELFFLEMKVSIDVDDMFIATMIYLDKENKQEVHKKYSFKNYSMYRTIDGLHNINMTNLKFINEKRIDL